MKETEAISSPLFIMNSLVSEWMKFRLAFMLDLLTPNDIETDCSCKMGMGAEVRRANIGNMKDVDEWGRRGLFCTDCGNQKEKIERRWRDSEGEINRRQRRLGKKRDDGSVDGIKYVDEEEREMPEGNLPLLSSLTLFLSPGRNALSPCSMSHTQEN